MLLQLYVCRGFVKLTEARGSRDKMVDDGAVVPLANICTGQSSLAMIAEASLCLTRFVMPSSLRLEQTSQSKYVHRNSTRVSTTRLTIHIHCRCLITRTPMICTLPRESCTHTHTLALYLSIGM
jgi:hypothetical protein